MGIFRRRSAEPKHAAEPDRSAEDTPADDAAAAPGVEDTGDAQVSEASEGAEATRTVVPGPAFDRSEGPFDVTEIDDDEQRLDLGALRLAPSEGVEVRVEIEEDTGGVQAVTFVADGTMLQAGVFAAPRSEGIWDEVRTEISAGITASGGTAEIVDGAFGPELHANLVGQDDKGRSALQPVRFVGVNGPRWFLRGLISGAGARDDAAAARVLASFRSTVVVRGDEPKAPHEPLALTLPAEAVAAVEEHGADEADGGPDLDPFTRGPEITEIR